MKEKWSELDLIALFTGNTGAPDTNGLIKGIGDDCAIFDPPDDLSWLATTDILVENVHFDRSWHPPHLLGRKSIAVNLSDIAAMGGTPHYALVSIAISDQLGKGWIEKWSAGAAEILEEFGCTIIGGDTVKGPALTINIVILGSGVKHRIIRRSSASAGENIYVSGDLGSAAAGLEICRTPALFESFTKDELQPLINKHLNPTPRLWLGQELAASGMVGAMQDISDGIATDLAHICRQSGVGAEIEASLLPGSEVLERVCHHLDSNPIDLKVAGGEDYELVFTVKKGRDEELLALLRENGREQVYMVGRTVAGSDVRLISAEGAVNIGFRGFQHRGSGR
ncbi:MAG: thiamine-phosphate kinase [Desulfocapsaceae bacterium]